MVDSNQPQGREPSRDMRESQRALELRKFFAPQQDGENRNESQFNESLNNDGALDAYAETIVWRLRGVHAMISLIDRGTQYFLAGAVRVVQEDDLDEVETVHEWYGCSTVETPGGLCENTLAVNQEDDECPCFIVNDLSKDDRFKDLPVVNGQVSSYRFYAGAPISTSNGINIGSIFLFDDVVRDGLSLSHRKFLHQQAANVMKHFETKREAAERRRAALMSKGIASFLEKSSEQHGSPNGSTASLSGDEETLVESTDGDDISSKKLSSKSLSKSTNLKSRKKETILDKIRVTLDHAAEILKESLDLAVGGVVFLDTTLGYNEIEKDDAYLDKSTDIGAQFHATVKEEENLENSTDEQSRPIPHHEDGTTLRHLSQTMTRSASDKHRPSKVLAMAAAEVATWDPKSKVLDSKTIQAFTNSYPKGNVWYIDDEGYFTSLDQVTDYEEQGRSPSGRRRSSIGSMDTTKQKAEATMLSKIFHRARQIIFLPLWDAVGDRWYSGCFVWSQSAVPVFTVDSEISYLSAFTNSVMVEISRLDAITANLMKTDFISSISHEFRSPLHGILASAEFLRDSELDASQLEFISTIQNCSGTLLDTINHVLDYSKINSFEKSGNAQGTISNELYQVTNLALLCEDVVNGMIAANEFRGTDDTSFPISFGNTSQGAQPQHGALRRQLEVVVDIQNRYWEYKIQPGALRRVVMNIFGNAQKYTKTGYIMLQLKVGDASGSTASGTEAGDMLSLRIRDSGRGMSSEFMERRLYRPFAQEDSFAPGVGLGLSIVWSIVNQLGGKISIQSELGQGTDVEVKIPVERESEPIITPYERPGNLRKMSEANEQCVTALRERATGKSVRFIRSNTNVSRYSQRAWNCIENYCSDWFGFQLKDEAADVVITDKDNEHAFHDSPRVLVIHDDLLSRNQVGKHGNRNIEHISQPIGPFKLARSLLVLLNQDSLPTSENSRTWTMDTGTQTPLASPAENTIMNGIIATDYGFGTAQPTSNPMVVRIPEEVKNEAIEEKANENVPATQEQSTSTEGLQSSILGDLSRFTMLQPPTSSPAPKPQPSTSSTAEATPTQITTPITPSKSKSTKSKASASIEPQIPLHILAVDDNALNLQLLHRYLLKRKSDTIVTAKHGLEALDAVKDNSAEQKYFDIIFMDISMPVCDGFEATRLIRTHERSHRHRSFDALEEGMRIVRLEDDVQSDSGVSLEDKATAAAETKVNEGKETKMRETLRRDRSYIVAVTGLASRRDRDEAEESGFDDFLTKPISFAKIGDLLRRLSQEKAALTAA